LMTSRKVRILMLAMSLDIGGAETHVVGLARALKAKNWDVYVASNGGRRVRDLVEAGIPHMAAPLHSRSPLDMFKAHLVVSRAVNRYGIGLVHAHARIPAWIGERICRSRRIPLVTTYHGAFVAGFPWNYFTKAGDLTIVVSQDIKDHVVQKFGFNQDKVYVIPNGIDLDMFRQRRPEEVEAQKEALGIPPTAKPVILYASRLAGGLTGAAVTAIDAVCSLLERYPGIRLLIAGHGTDLPRVEEKVSEVNKAQGREIAKCLGFVLDMAPLYHVSDVVLGMSRVALEAMACERPVIIFGPEGIFGPVSEENADVLEECNFTSRGAPLPPSAQTLGEQIRKLLDDPQLCRDLGESGRGIVARNHSMEVVAAETEKLYQKVLSSFFSS